MRELQRDRDNYMEELDRQRGQDKELQQAQDNHRRKLAALREELRDRHPKTGLSHPQLLVIQSSATLSCYSSHRDTPQVQSGGLAIGDTGEIPGRPTGLG